MTSRAALHQALAVMATALAAAVMHIEQPFLAVLAAQLIAVIPCAGGGELLRRLAAAWGGTLSGVFLLAAFPQQPWFSLPAFAALSGFGSVCADKKLGPAPGILFAVGCCATFTNGIVYPVAGLVGGIFHAISLTAAAVVTFLLQPLAPPASAAAPSPIPGGWLVGVCGAVSLVLACLTLPSQSVVMTIAALTCVLSLTRTGNAIVQKPLGGILGAVLSIAFIIAISDFTNNLAVFLLGMGLVIGGLEALAQRRPDRALLLRQAAAMFVVLATILPRPETSLQAVGERLAAVLLGLAAAVVLSLVDWAVDKVPGEVFTTEARRRRET